MFIVTPFVSSNTALYGIFTIITSAFIFLSYADLGFLGAGMKYASECYAKGDKTEEMEVIGFTGFVLLSLVAPFMISMLFFSFNPIILIKGVEDANSLNIARSLFLVIAFSSPIVALQRIIQIVFGIRMLDFVFQRVLIVSNIFKISSAFLFFGNGKYLIVEYFVFSQLCTTIAVIIGFYLIKNKLNYDLLQFVKCFKFSKKLFEQTKKIAFSSLFLTFCWILYFEIDSFIIGKYLGIEQVSIYAIGLTVSTYLRSFFGVLFTPFVAKINYFVGLNDNGGVQEFMLKSFIIFAPITVLPVITIALTAKKMILCWVGETYLSSLIVVQILVLCYAFSFIHSPTGILIIAYEKVKLLYYTSILQPVVYWVGIFFTINYLGVSSFAYFKFVVFLIQTLIYIYILLVYFRINFVFLIKELLVPIIISSALIFFLVYFSESIVTAQNSKTNLLQYIMYDLVVISLGILCYYTFSASFRKYTKHLLTEIIHKKKHIHI